MRHAGYRMFLDDVRDPADIYPEHPDEWVVVRTSNEAIKYVLEHGMPDMFSLDHDLGGEDKAEYFLKWLAYEYWTNEPVPAFRIHSANPVGAKNLDAFMNSWHKVSAKK